MSEYRVGDKVKTRLGIGTIWIIRSYSITEKIKTKTLYTVKTSTPSGDYLCSLFFKSDLELCEDQFQLQLPEELFII